MTDIHVHLKCDDGHVFKLDVPVAENGKSIVDAGIIEYRGRFFIYEHAASIQTAIFTEALRITLTDQRDGSVR